MNKETFIRKYDEFCRGYRLPRKHAVISAGGALMMFGLREETQDLDLDVPEDLYDWLKERKVGFLVETPMGEYIEHGDYSIHRGIKSQYQTVVVGSVCCYRPIDILHQKETLVRSAEHTEKLTQDKIDIEQLKEYTSTGGLLRTLLGESA